MPGASRIAFGLAEPVGLEVLSTGTPVNCGQDRGTAFRKRPAEIALRSKLAAGERLGREGFLEDWGENALGT